MENEFNDSVTIELDRTRILRASYKALKKIENMTGLHVMKLGDNLSIQQYATILFCLMEADAKSSGEQISLSFVEELLDKYPIGRVVRAINGAFLAATGEEKSENTNSENADVKNAEGTEISSETP